MKKLFLLFLLSINVTIITAQTITTSNLTGKRQQFTEQKSGHFYYSIQTKDDSIKTYDLDLLETENVIVEFTVPPMFQPNKNRLQKRAVSDYQNLFDNFSQDLSELSHSFNTKTKLSKSAPIIKKEFYKLFTGVNVEVPKGLLASISSLSYVKNIYKNNRVYPLEKEELSKYNYVTKTGDFANVKGDNVVVGVIDTGIDYMHPELGGGFGPDYKVIGGYDLINDDDDPMDDIGHGTHVAGIIAADGDSLIGVAPHAKLMAFKIFSPTKDTYDTDVIAGIEKCVDPNDDGNFDDKVDIINMSLGSSGNPEDPVSTTVDNASELGIISCVAAGNDYSFFSIGSPANARSAIGVGASDYDNNIANFSSKGPTKKTYAIKPDVLAPGVDVYSTYLNNTFKKLRGTSMATPYIAGICVLLKQLHENWSPGKIKSVIMTTATSLPNDIMEQGAGIVNPDRALNEQTTITPSSLNYGFCNSKVDVWIKTDTLLIKNNSSVSKDYSINILDPMLEAFPSNLTIAPNDSEYVYVKLTADNNRLDFLQSGSRSYNGNINISNGSEQLHIPWAFVKTTRIFLSFDTPPVYFTITNNNDFYSSFNADWNEDYTQVELILSSSTYNITSLFVQFGNDTLLSNIQGFKIVNYENVKVENGDSILINSEDAKNQLYFEATDETGTELSKKMNWSGDLSLIYPDSLQVNSLSFSIDSGITLSFSDLSQQFSLLSGEFEKDYNTNKIYLYYHDVVNGVNSDIYLTNNSDNNYITANLDVYHSPFVDTHKLYFGKSIGLIFLDDSPGYYASYQDPIELYGNHWKGSLYISPNQSNQYGFSTNIYEPLTEDLYPGYSWIATNMVAVRNDSIGFRSLFDSTNTKFMVPNGGDIIIGKGISVPNSNLFYPYSSTDYGYYFNLGFIGQFGEYRYSDFQNTTYKLLNRTDDIIRQGSFDSSSINFDALSAGNYRLEMKHSNYTVEKERGTLSMKFCFYKRKNYDISPSITETLQILNSKNIPSTLLEKNEKASILFSVVNFSQRDNLYMFVKEQNSNSWDTLNIEYLHYNSQYGFVYSADLSNYTNFDSTALDLKLELFDGSTYKSELTWEPAVGIGKFEGSLEPVLVEPEENDLPVEYKLYNSYPNPFNPATTISYSIPKQSFVKLKVYDILGREIKTLVDEKKSAGYYQVKFEANDLPCGIYFYRLIAGNFTQTKKLLLIK